MERLYSLQTRCIKTKPPRTAEGVLLKISGRITELEAEKQQASASTEKAAALLATGLETGAILPRRVIELKDEVEKQKRIITACDDILTNLKIRLKEAERALEQSNALANQLPREIEERRQMIVSAEKDLERVFNPVREQDRPMIEKKITECKAEIEQLEALFTSFLQVAEPAPIPG